ncbi:MAG: alpha/beta fold hydrolase [Planctomycetota bacterium]
MSAHLDDRAARTRARLAPIAGQFPFPPRFLSHAGVHQHYVDEGPRDAAPLLFLHGNPTWSFLWRRPIAALGDRYRCVAPDHVGCGMSDQPADYEYRLLRHVANVERLVESLRLTRITLVMHDWGGPIGFGFARRHPDLVARLVILNTAAFRLDRLPWRLAACRVPGLGPLLVRGLNGFARGATRMAVARPLPPAVRKGYLLPYATWASRVALLRFVQDIPLSPSHPSYAEAEAIDRALDSFRDRPAALLWGERDWCFTPAVRARFEARLPGAEVHRFAAAAHLVVEDAADAVVAAIAGFLARNPLP